MLKLRLGLLKVDSEPGPCAGNMHVLSGASWPLPAELEASQNHVNTLVHTLSLSKKEIKKKNAYPF